MDSISIPAAHYSEMLRALAYQTKELHALSKAVFVESQSKKPSKKDLAKHSYTALMTSNRMADILEQLASYLDQSQTAQQAIEGANND